MSTDRHLFDLVTPAASVAAAAGHAGTVNGAGVDTSLASDSVYALALIDAGTDYRVDIQHSDDDAATDPYTDIVTGTARTAAGAFAEGFRKAFDVDGAGVSGYKRWVRAVLVVNAGTVDGAVGIVIANRHSKP